MKHSHRVLLTCAFASSLYLAPLYADDKTVSTDDSLAGMAGSMYNGMLDVMSKPETIAKMAHSHKLYFDALIKEGFTREEALKIVADSDPLGGRSK